MKRHTPISVLLILILNLASVSAQESANISGVVTDPNGAVVAGAQVTAVNTLTREQRRATTDAQGQYAIDNLAPGAYTVTVSASGFATATRDVRLGAANGAVDFRLSIRAVGETVTVEAETARVELERTPGATSPRLARTTCATSSSIRRVCWRNRASVPIVTGLAVAASVRMNSGPIRLLQKEKRYELRGVVKSVDRTNRRATIKHEKVGDYMDAMTMPFLIKDEKALNTMRPGDQIKATLVVTGDGGLWLENVAITSKGNASLQEKNAQTEVVLVNC
jgi:Cu/Ag efflux protein CusF